MRWWANTGEYVVFVNVYQILFVAIVWKKEINSIKKQMNENKERSMF